MASMREADEVYDRYPVLRTDGVMLGNVADVIMMLEAEVARLRAALAGLVGASDPDELRQMEAMTRLLPAPAADKAAMLDAIHALLA